MLDLFHQLGPAGQSGGAEIVGPFPVNFGPAGRATVRHLEFLSPFAPRFLDPLRHLGDDVPGPLHPDRVPGAEIFLLHLVLVMEGGPADRHPAHLDRVEEGDRGQHPGPPHLDHDVLQAGDLFLRGKFPGQGPAGAAVPLAQPLAQAVVVDLDHHPVDLVIQLVALLLQLPVTFLDLPARPGRAVFRVDREPPLAEPVEFLPVGGEFGRSGLQHLIKKDQEGFPLRLFRVEPAHRPGGGVPGVGESLLSLFHPLPVQFLEPFPVHQDLAPDGQEFRRIAPQPEGQGGYGLQVVGNLLPGLAVPPGRSPGQGPLFVNRLDREPVELGFEKELRGLLPGLFLQGIEVIRHLFRLENRVQAEHSRGVLDFLQFLDRLRPDFLRR